MAIIQGTRGLFQSTDPEPPQLSIVTGFDDQDPAHLILVAFPRAGAVGVRHAVAADFEGPLPEWAGGHFTEWADPDPDQQAQIDALAGTVATMQTTIDGQATTITGLQSDLTALAARVTALETPNP